MEKIRIQKFISSAGIMSRRHAERAVLEGRIKVNGAVAVIGMSVDPDNDTVTVDDIPINKAPISEHIYIMLNKPRGYVTTMSDEKGRSTVADLISDVGRRVYPVGRLDMYSEGLLILTDDGECANRLMHPSSDVKKTYAVRLDGSVPKETVELLERPMKIDEYVTRPAEVRLISSDRISKKGRTVTDIIVTINEGRNRQIRRMCEAADLSVVRLRRISEGELHLGNLPLGKWRFLTEKEIKYIKSI